MKIKVVLLLLVLHSVVFAVQASAAWYLWPFGENFNWWQLVTYSLVHASIPHFLLNMLALVSFAPTLERHWGSARFAALYLFCVVGAGVIQAWVGTAPTVGASGAILGLFVAYAWNDPKRRIGRFVRLPAWVLVVAYVVLSLGLHLFGMLPAVAHAAHLGGMAAGALFCAAIPYKSSGV